MNEVSELPVRAGLPLDPRRTAAHARTVQRGFWRKIARFAGRVPFADEAVAAYFCAVDPATPGRVKATILAALAYFVLPADMVPDIIAGLGFTDDATVFLAAWQVVSPHVKPAHRERAAQALQTVAPGRD